MSGESSAWVTSCAASALPWWDCTGQDGPIKQSLLPKTGFLSLYEKEEKLFEKWGVCIMFFGSRFARRGKVAVKSFSFHPLDLLCCCVPSALHQWKPLFASQCS